MAASIDAGKVAEYRLAAELLDRNIVPLWPSSEMYPYDLVADTGANRHRIQVKGTKQTGSSVSVDCRMKTGKRRRKYTKKDTDFIVLHIFEFKAWYVIPVEKVQTGEVTVRPGNPDCKWAKYMSAWDLLD
jgi:hypothetical protein